MYRAILRAVVGLYCQTVVGPQLPLALESLRRLHQCHQMRGRQLSRSVNLKAAALVGLVAQRQEEAVLAETTGICV